MWCGFFKFLICTVYITFFTQLIGITGCKAGFFGDFCDEPCPPGYFGLRCGGKCVPMCTIEECNHITGCLKDKMTGTKYNEPSTRCICAKKYNGILFHGLIY